MKHHSPRTNANERRAQHVARLRPLLALPLIETPDRIIPIAEACIRLNESRTTIWRKTRDGDCRNRWAVGL